MVLLFGAACASARCSPRRMAGIGGGPWLSRQRVEDNPKTAYGHGLAALRYVGLVSPGLRVSGDSAADPDVGIPARCRMSAASSRGAAGAALQIAPAQDLARFRAQEEKRLDTYYWVDKSKGIVHIPIAEAMKKLATEGIAGFPKATTP